MTLLVTARIVSSLVLLQILRARVFLLICWHGHARRLEMCHFKEQIHQLSTLLVIA